MRTVSAAWPQEGGEGGKGGGGSTSPPSPPFPASIGARTGTLAQEREWLAVRAECDGHRAKVRMSPRGRVPEDRVHFEGTHFEGIVNSLFRRHR